MDLAINQKGRGSSYTWGRRKRSGNPVELDSESLDLD